MDTKDKKLCSHALNGACHYGAACTAAHPADVEAALAEFNVKKTLNICGFYPKCTRPECTFLHAATLPRASASAGAPAQAQKSKPSRAPPTGRTPARGREAPRPAARAEQAPRDKELPAYAVLGQIRGKIKAIHGVEVAYRALSASLPAGSMAAEAADKADQANAMLEEVLRSLGVLAQGVDAYLDALGTRAEAEPEAEAAASPRDAPRSGRAGAEPESARTEDASASPPE